MRENIDELTLRKMVNKILTKLWPVPCKLQLVEIFVGKILTNHQKCVIFPHQQFSLINKTDLSVMYCMAQIFDEGKY